MTEPTSPSRVERRHEAEFRRRRLFVFGGATLLVVAAVIVAVALLSGGSDDASTQGANAGGQTTASTAGGTDTTGTTDTTATTTPENKAKPLTTGVCSADQLEASPVASGVRGARQVVVIEVTNQSQRSCTLNGAVASIALVSSGGGKQPAVVAVGGEGINPELVAQEIVLAPGAQASMVASWSPVQLPADTAPCVLATGMQMVMPASKGAVDVDGSATVCAGGAISVSPLQPGVVGI